MESPDLPYSGQRLEELWARVLSWYRRERRDLPWRRTRDPYRVWISEVMLQQTRVETVKPYYERFLLRFPTVRSLAEAPPDEVLSLWSGLGYYARARSLHRAATIICEAHGGELPGEEASLSRLPGFGPYTTAAVGSIALGLDLAAVDGNIARVLCRWLCLEGDPREAAILRGLRRTAGSLLPRGEAGDWNQALMELGATLCTPGRPACLTCPAADHCLAFREGRQGELPPRRKAGPRPVLHLAAGLAREGAKVLLARRPAEGLFASLWELPAVEVGEGEAPSAALSRWMGVEVGSEALASVEQTLTHRELRITVYEVGAGEGIRVAEPYVDQRWVDPSSSMPGGVASVTKKALRACE